MKLIALIRIVVRRSSVADEVYRLLTRYAEGERTRMLAGQLCSAYLQEIGWVAAAPTGDDQRAACAWLLGAAWADVTGDAPTRDRLLAHASDRLGLPIASSSVSRLAAPILRLAARLPGGEVVGEYLAGEYGTNLADRARDAFRLVALSGGDAPLRGDALPLAWGISVMLHELSGDEVARDRMVVWAADDLLHEGYALDEVEA